jgi:hypothetical protein
MVISSDSLAKPQAIKPDGGLEKKKRAPPLVPLFKVR